MNGFKPWLAAGLLAASGWTCAQPLAAEADWRYVIQPGDTLITLTDAWLASPKTWRDLQQLNRVPDPLRLRPGATLRMPVAWLRREASVAEAVFVKGDVQLRRGAASETLASGAMLRSGDRLLTGAQARWYGCPPQAEQRIYFANHQSHADLVMIWAALPQELRAITRPVNLEVEYAGEVKDPWGGTRAGFTAKTSIVRSDFGLTWNQALEAGGVVVGDKIEISIEVEAVKAVAVAA